VKPFILIKKYKVPGRGLKKKKVTKEPERTLMQVVATRQVRAGVRLSDKR